MEQAKYTTIDQNLAQIEQQSSQDEKTTKKKLKNFKVNHNRRSNLKRVESNNFNNPIYAGLQDQVLNKEQHNFGPWVGNQLLGRQVSRQRKKIVRIVQRQPLLHDYNPQPINQYIDFRNWESNLRTHYVPSSHSNRHERQNHQIQRVFYLQSPPRNSPDFSNFNPSTNFNSNSNLIGNSRNSLPTLNLQYRKNSLIQNMRFSSTQIFKNTNSQQPKGKKNSPNKIISEMKIANGVKAKGKYGLNIPFVSLDCQKTDSPRKISKVIYNYCYDDDLISSRLNPQISRIADINMRAQMLEKLKRQLKNRNIKTNSVTNPKKSKSHMLLNLYKGKNK